MKVKLLLILLLLPVILFSQESPFDSTSKSYSTFFKSFKTDSIFSLRSQKGYVPALFHNLGRQATFPFRLKGKDFLILGGTIIGTAVLLHYDEEIDVVFKPIKNANPFIKNVSPHYTELGDYYGYALVAGLSGFGMATHNYRLFRTTLMASQAAITAGLWIRLGKMVTSRMRPEAVYTDVEFHSDHWFGPFAQFGSHRGIAAFDAFPSGHTGTAFAFATIFSKEYSEYKAIPITLYSAAGLIGISRMIEHTHWASDVFLGAIIGYYCGKQVYNNEKRLFPVYKNKGRKTTSVIFPFQNDGVTGLTWKYTY